MTSLADPPQATGRSREATRTTRRLLHRSDVTVLDTETTDLYGRVVQIGALDLHAGDILLNQLVDPSPDAMTAEATAKTGITDDQLGGQPRFPAVASGLRRLLDHTTVVAYNAPYDRDVLTAEYHRFGSIPPRVEWVCAMRLYRDWLGINEDIALPGGDHTALGDSSALRALLQQIAIGPPPRELVARAFATVQRRGHDRIEPEPATAVGPLSPKGGATA